MENTEEKKSEAGTTEATTPKTEKKNMVWIYDSVTHHLTAVFPSGTKRGFNLTARVTGMAYSDELMFQYGVRQWLSSNASALTEEADKIERFMSDFEGFTTKGLVLSDGGNKIQIVGKERVNAPANSEEKQMVKQLSAMRKDLDGEKLKAMRVLGFQLSADEQAVLAEYEAGEGLEA